MPEALLLLSALWDAAFDGGLVSFPDDGAAIPGARAVAGVVGVVVPRTAGGAARVDGGEPGAVAVASGGVWVG